MPSFCLLGHLYVIGGPIFVVTKKLIMRFLGAILGIPFILMGIWSLIHPIFGGITEMLSHISQILIGSLFLFYAVTGYSSIYKFIHRNNKR